VSYGLGNTVIHQYIVKFSVMLYSVKPDLKISNPFTSPKKIRFRQISAQHGGGNGLMPSYYTLIYSKTHLTWGFFFSI